MESGEDKLKALRTVYRLLQPIRLAVWEDEPSVLVQRVTRQVLPCGGPAERFSDRMPSWIPASSADSNLRPMDILYGCYNTRYRAVEIYVNNIRQAAHEYGIPAEDLTEVVRIHMHGHAIIHLGVGVDELPSELLKLGNKGDTDWGEFALRRRTWFEGQSEEFHEGLAQAVTYAALSSIRSAERVERLRKAFDALEARQPLSCRLPVRVKQDVVRADWWCVMAGARDPSLDTESGLSRLQVVFSLMCADPEPEAAGKAPEKKKPPRKKSLE